MNPKKLPDSELEIMLVIWNSGGQVSTSDIMARLGQGKKVQLVQSYLNRLEEKGFVSCQKIGRLNHYTPLVDLAAYREQETAQFVRRFYHNSPTKLFAALLENSAISDRELEELKSLLEKGGDDPC